MITSYGLGLSLINNLCTEQPPAKRWARTSDARAKLFSGFGRAGPDFFGPRAGRAFDENYFGRANGP